MVSKLKNAVRGRGQGSRDILIQRLEGELDAIYDFIYQVFGDEEAAVKVLRSTIKVAVRRMRTEQYERYLRLWALRIAVQAIRPAYARYLSEWVPGQPLPLEGLALEEKLAVFLHDRVGLANAEIASVLQLQIGKVGRLLTYGREKVARQVVGADWEHESSATLRERVALNLELVPRAAAPASAYAVAMSQAADHVRRLDGKRFSEIEASVRTQQLLPALSQGGGFRWQDLSWQAKLGLEASFLGVAGLIAVVVLPWTIDRVNMNALVEGRFDEVLEVPSQAQNVPKLEITTDRLLAVTDGEGGATEEEDEFAEMEFPSGDAYEPGSAPLAPSRQSANVYRLIVQSPSPQELVPHVRTLFVQRNVRERESSGRSMPGGVYFDGVTSVANYPLILKEIEKLGQTKTYSNPGASRNPNERARVIVWLQQI